MKNLFNRFLEFSIGLKILIIFTAIFVVSGVCMGTYILMQNKQEETTMALASSENEKSKIPEDVIEKIAEQTIQIAEEPIEEEKKEEVVEYKDKKIKIPKAKVAAVDSAEDAEKEKTGGEQMSAADAINKYENDGQCVGIDVSKHQGTINWAAVKSSGIEFAMIRCGFRGQTAGEIYEDTYFKANIKGAVSNGIKVGIYFYSCAINEEEAIQEAAWVVNAIKTYRITYPVVYDFEDFGRYRCSGVSGEQATSNAIAFLEYVKKAGYTPMMYASKNDITNRFNRSRLSSYKFWLAHYTSTTNYTGKYQMWQYTSNGTVNGISGRVDMNIAYFTYGAVAEPKHTHDFEKGTVIKTNDSKPATCEEDGVKYIRCASCSESEKVILPALGHTYGKWIIDKEATLEEVGEKHRICSVCEKEEKDEIPKLEDEKQNENTTDDNIIDKENCQHEYEIKTTPSTCKVNGKSWEECSICKDVKNEKTLDLVEHEYGEEQKREDGTYYQKCKNCESEKDIIKEEKPIVTP